MSGLLISLYCSFQVIVGHTEGRESVSIIAVVAKVLHLGFRHPNFNSAQRRKGRLDVRNVIDVSY
jgi:hypothetical protein